MENVVSEKAISVLEDRIIKVEPIVRGRAFFKKGHDGEFMFTNCWKFFGLPISTKTRSYMNPFKSVEEREEFERLLNLPKGDLNTSNTKSKFWGTYGIRLDKTGTTLDLSVVDHALTYRILCVNPRFAKQGDDINNPEYQFKLVDERYQEESYSKLALKKSEAYTELNKIAKSKKQMMDTLRLLEVKMSESSSMEALKARLAQIVEEPASNKAGGVKTIDDFMRVVNDPQAIHKLFVLDAIEFGEVKVLNGNEFRLTETGGLIGRSLQGAVDWFSNLENQETKLLIQERLKVK